MSNSMSRTEAAERLRQCADAIQAMGATKLYLYGSTVRDEAKLRSDLDLFVEYDQAQGFNAFDLIGIKLLLPETLGTEVDLTTRDGLCTVAYAKRSRARRCGCFDGAAGVSPRPRRSAFRYRRHPARDGRPKVRAVGSVLRHEYHGLSDPIIWGVVKDELPRLRIAEDAIRAMDP